ncbi:MAG TPA: EAL domain-containing protein [Aquabacterium sp.]|nr:EAL domain-containing protein [Aquabacterium sp.]
MPPWSSTDVAGPPAGPVDRAGGLATRLHALLMPDYNRRATAYWWSVVLAGGTALVLALASLADLPAQAAWQVAVGLVIIVLAGLFPVRIPRSIHSVTAGETFIFLLLLLHGPAAATLAASVDAAIGSSRSSRRWTSRIASPAMAALAMTAAGHALEAVESQLQRHQLGNPGLLVLACIGFALLYFACNATLMAVLPRLKRAERFRPADLLQLFGWIATAYAASATLAALLFLVYRQSGIGVLAAVLPLIAMMLATLHFFFRQQEAAEAVRRATAEAAAREAGLAARHLAEVEQIAFHDSLTGLPNRRSFQTRLAEAVARCHATPPGPGYAVMFLDFDRFKRINDSLGHAAGDAFLVQAAQRLQALSGPDDVLARLGGDEFALLMHAPPDLASVHARAAALLQALRTPFAVAGTELDASASIGITSSALGYTRPEDVLRDADIAMYRAKAAGRARHVVFDAQLHAQVMQRLRLETDLRRAVRSDQIGLAYQPIFELASGQVVGFEALARWTHPDLGPVSPGTFVALAADAGVATELTDQLVLRACRQLRYWQTTLPGTGALVMHLNITGRDLVHGSLTDRLLQALHDTGLQPRHLRLELDEDTLMQHIDAALPVLAQLRQHGIALSLDDFGSGYSSLRHLHALPIDSLKIDPSFVQSLLGSETVAGDAGVVRAVVELGRSLGKGVIAEGIESASQLALLRAMGCLQGQGYHLAPPLAPGAVPALLAQTGPLERSPASAAAIALVNVQPSSLRH